MMLFPFYLLALLVIVSPFSYRHCHLSMMQKHSEPKKAVIVEIEVRNSIRKNEVSSVSARKVYKEAKIDVVDKVIDSPATKIFEILFNPTYMLLALYVSSIGWSKVLWLQRFFKIFGRGTLVKKSGEPDKPDTAVFQTFECEVCQMELRPAEGRAKAIFSRPRFRCARCGAKADAYFDISDMNDDRAVARLERLKREREDADDQDIEGNSSE